jgi:hypothetical protein
MITTVDETGIETRYTPYVSVRPDKAVLRWVKETYRVTYKGGFKRFEKIEKPRKKSATGEKPLIERKFHNFQISAQSRKNIIEKIVWLNQFAKPRTIRTYSGKYIHNFRTSFITLTLPSPQRHPTAELSNECFDRFLTTLRNRLKMTNYVWKLEFQENGNVHYHLITDTYVDYFFALKHWNNIIEKFGYVSEYSEKMSALSFQQYRELPSNRDNADIKELARRYEKGRREKWRNPNSVDVKAVRTDGNLRYYLAKYFAKEKGAGTGSKFDNEENSFGLRLAFWSRSLSKVGAVSMPEEFYQFDFSVFFEECKEVTLRIYDYCRVAYFNIRKLANEQKRALYLLFHQMRDNFGYIPAV